MKKSVRKILSLLMAAMMLSTLIPTALAAEPPKSPTVLEEVTLELAAPEAGKADISASGTGYQVSGTWDVTDEPLLPDHDYTASLTVTAAEGYVFAETPVVKDGENGPVAGVVRAEDGKTLTLQVVRHTAPQTSGTPDTPSQEPIPVDHVTVTFPKAVCVGDKAAPIYGNVDEYTAAGNWIADGAVFEGNFEAGKTYTFRHEITIREGYVFAPSVKVEGIVPNDTVLEAILTPVDGKLTYSHDFTPLAGLISSYEMTTAEGMLTPTESMVVDTEDTEHHVSVHQYHVQNFIDLPAGQEMKPGAAMVAIKLTAMEGYQFADQVALKINGEDMTCYRTTPTQVSVVLDIMVAEPPAQPVYVASISRSGSDVFFETLDEAIAAAADGETIQVLTDTSTAWTQGYFMGKSLTFQLNGHTVSFPAGFCIPGSKTVKFVGGAVNMTGVTKGCNEYGSYSFGAAIVLNGSGVLELDGTAYTISGTKGDGIYGHPDCTIKVTNGSQLTIAGSTGNGITKDNGGAKINVSGGSALNVTGNNAGITNTWDVTVIGSTLNVSNNKGNGSNGSNYTAENATVTFNGNGSFGMSAGKVTGVNSTITASGNGLNGINTNNTLTLTNCQTTVTGNGCDVDSKWSKPGAITVQKAATITGGTLTITGNGGSGIRAWKGNAPLTIQDCAATITGNTAKRAGLGGGILSDSPVTLDDKVIIANNHASQAGDDLYTTAAIRIPAAPTALSLDGQAGNCLLKIDGWYIDPAEARWNAHDPEHILVTRENETSFPSGVALKAAHGLARKDVHVPATITFHKVDSATGKAVANAVFTLYADEKCTEKADTFTSGKDGAFTMTLTAGTYYLKETGTPKGYRADNTVYEIQVKELEGRFEQVVNTAVTPNEVIYQTTFPAEAQVKGLTAGKDGSYSIANEAIRDLTIRKVWKGDKNSLKNRPEKIEISFLENGKETERYTLTAKDNWELTLEDLPVYDKDGKAIEYTVKELTKLKDYTVSYQDEGLTVVNTLKVKPGVSPQTGDESHLLLWTGLMAFSALAAGFLLVDKRRKA